MPGFVAVVANNRLIAWWRVVVVVSSWLIAAVPIVWSITAPVVAILALGGIPVIVPVVSVIIAWLWPLKSIYSRGSPFAIKFF